MEEYKIYSKESYHHLQTALPIAKTIAHEYQESQTASYQSSNMDAMYLATNKQKRLDRSIESNNGIEFNNGNGKSNGPTISKSVIKLEDDASATSFSTVEDDDYQYSSSSDDDEEQLKVKPDTTIASTTPSPLSSLSSTKPNIPSKAKKSHSKNKRTLGTPPLITLPLQKPSTINTNTTNTTNITTTSTTLPIMELPRALLSPSYSSSSSSSSIVSELDTICQEYLHLSQRISTQPIIILLLQSGRFAGAIFQNNQCLHHKVYTQYTVRRGQGGSQSNADHRKKAKSMGAQLRRAGEEKLQLDILTFLQQATSYLQRSALIFQSCPKPMLPILVQHQEYVHAKQCGNVRNIPLSVKRPSYDMACQVHSILMRVLIREISVEEYRSKFCFILESEDVGVVPKKESRQTISSLTQTQTSSSSSSSSSPPPLPPSSPPKPAVLPLTPLHQAAASGNFEELQKHAINNIINNNNDNDNDMINLRAGETQMTALHYAASSTSPQAPTCITYLLQTCHADPCSLDAHHRPPYYLATNDKIRDAFRRSRSELGEDYCAWDSIAKVGPAMTSMDVVTKKQKMVEKKKRQRQRQKEKKALERLEQLRLEEEREQVQKEMELKRVRAGLTPKAPSMISNICDYCQEAKKGMKRSQMFQRLDFWYCSTDCVKKHQRELSANAALARFNK